MSLHKAAQSNTSSIKCKRSASVSASASAAQAQHSATQRNTVQRRTAQCNTTQRNATRRRTGQYGTGPDRKTQHSIDTTFVRYAHRACTWRSTCPCVTARSGVWHRCARAVETAEWGASRSGMIPHAPVMRVAPPRPPGPPPGHRPLAPGAAPSRRAWRPAPVEGARPCPAPCLGALAWPARFVRGASRKRLVRLASLCMHTPLGACLFRALK